MCVVLMDITLNLHSSIILDYEATLFGNNRWSVGAKGGCMFDFQYQPGDSARTPLAGRRLSHVDTGATPLFIHSSGKFTSCQDSMLDKLHAKTSNDLKNAADWNDSHTVVAGSSDSTMLELVDRRRLTIISDVEVPPNPSNYKASFSRPSKAPSYVELKWYPEFGSEEIRCLNDGDHTKTQLGIELFESVEECCQGEKRSSSFFHSKHLNTLMYLLAHFSMN